ncbi:tRNA methyltransferase 10 -like protein [Brachionus plicatilis]|uniref:tRNA (guanine(9)-N(1))-methyltransferase n=1 Tax=Brachionus plicatilis TaxID=10195 RepID=A0A3M7PE37_BRAPC|nr:tRNA methyltransferase 10 -like protein [Brachionus plicatilis]
MEPTVQSAENPDTETNTDLNVDLNSNIELKKPLSRNQEKKLKRLEKALQNRAVRRKKERETRRAKGKQNYAVMENMNGEKVEIKRKDLKKNLMANSANKLKIVIDCSFESLMNYSDINHLCKQLTYCYAANRRIEAPLQFYMTSCSNKTRELLEKSGLANWDAYIHDTNYLQVFSDIPKQDIVYLTSDSPNEIQEFDDNKVYVIGGLVDHNHHKLLTYNLALKNEISHCRLPIGKFIYMNSRPVLTVNQVFQIICKYTECKDWKTAFVSTLPKRKKAELVDKDDVETDNSDSNNEKEKSPVKKVKKENLDDTNTETDQNIEIQVKPEGY